MRKHIDTNPLREMFMNDLESDIGYQALNKKWAGKPTIKILWQNISGEIVRRYGYGI